MALGSFSNGDHSAPNAEINMVPLIDVMLVLLVIFIITVPLLTHSVKVDLPKAESSANITQTEHIAFAVKEGGALFWNGEPVSLGELPARFTAAAALVPQPELHIHADRHARYESVALVMSAAAKAGLARIGFITDPSLEQKPQVTSETP